MMCPSCQTDVADDAAVCPACDFIIDPSAFSDEPPPDAPSAPKRSSASLRAAKKTTGTQKKHGSSGVPAGGSKPQPVRRAMPEAPPRRSKTPPERRAPLEDWHVAPSPRVDPASLSGPGSSALDPEEEMAAARTFLASLTFSDRLAFWGAIATLFACFLPFRVTAAEGESIGLLSLGALVFGANVLLLASVVVRVRKVAKKTHALVPWLLQFGTSAFSIGWCLVLIKLAVNTTKARALYGNEEVWVSAPGAGVVLAVVTSIVALAGTLMGLREKPD